MVIEIKLQYYQEMNRCILIAAVQTVTVITVMQSTCARYRNLCSNFTKLLLLICSPICGLKLSKKNTYSHTPKEDSLHSLHSDVLYAYINSWGWYLCLTTIPQTTQLPLANIFNMHSYKPHKPSFRLQSKPNLILCCGFTTYYASL